MADIEDIHLRRIDMGQLLVFSALMRLRKQTAVAQELGLTQSAISHALKRLRETFGDALFLRRQDGIEPTARATVLEPKVNEIISMTRETLGLENEFDPVSDDRVFRLGSLDYETAVFAAPLIELLRRQAPNLRVGFSNVARRDAMTALERGQIDLAMGFFWDVESPIETEVLFEEDYRVVFRNKHPLAAEGFDMKTYLKASHLLVSFDGEFSGIVDRTLEREGLSRHVAATVPHFFPALATVAQTDLIATLPTRLAIAHAARFGLQTEEPPLVLRSYPVSAAWHARNSNSGALIWLRERLATISDAKRT